ncbi:MAG: hypothetical protein ACYCW6_13385, partial [Candidatus Xenobia bacterium]
EHDLVASTDVEFLLISRTFDMIVDGHIGTSAAMQSLGGLSDAPSNLSPTLTERVVRPFLRPLILTEKAAYATDYVNDVRPYLDNPATADTDAMKRKLSADCQVPGLVSTLLPNYPRAMAQFERYRTWLAAAETNAALALYHAQHKRWPASLAFFPHAQSYVSPDGKFNYAATSHGYTLEASLAKGNALWTNETKLSLHPFVDSEFPAAH